MPTRVVASVLLFMFTIVATLTPGAIEAQMPEADSAAASKLVADAEAFMAAYGDDLRNGDRASLGRRYDPAGTHELRPGQVRRSSHDAIADRYARAWQKPSDFEWRDLTYEVVGPDRVLFLAFVSATLGWFAGTRRNRSYRQDNVSAADFA